MDIDQAIGKVGGYRRWHMAAFVVISVSMFIPLATQGLGIVFIGYSPPHHCKLPHGHQGNTSIPVDPHTGESSSCLLYSNRSESNTTTMSCPDGWTYHTQGEATIVTEWDLVCDSNYMADLTQVIYQLGGMMSDIGGSILTDYYGRKWVHTGSYFFIVACGTGLAFTQSFLEFAVLRFVIAFVVSAGCAAGLTMLMEMFDSAHRSFAGIMLEVAWVLSYMYTGLLGWLIPDWRMLQIVSSLSALIGLLTILVPESALWYEANGRVKEAEEVLQKMARYNGVKLEGHLLYTDETDIALLGKTDSSSCSKSTQLSKIQTEKQGSKRRQESILDLFTEPLLRKFTIIASALWFCNNLVFYFMILSSAAVAGNRFVNYFLGGLVEIPAIFVSYYFVRISRRVTTCVMHICAGVCLIAFAFIPNKTASGTDLTYLILTMVLLGKFFISCSFNVIILYTKELYPTNLRAISSGVVIFLGRLGNIAAPFAAYFVRKTPWLINVSLGVISIIVALMTLMLPETRSWPLPQCIGDVYTFTRGRPRLRSRHRSSPYVSVGDVAAAT